MFNPTKTHRGEGGLKHNLLGTRDDKLLQRFSSSSNSGNVLLKHSSGHSKGKNKLSCSLDGSEGTTGYECGPQEAAGIRDGGAVHINGNMGEGSIVPGLLGLRMNNDFTWSQPNT